MAQELDYRPATSEIPTEPGVYRFLDAAGRVLYVGKAKNLRARLSNYFGPLESLHERTRRMVTSSVDVKWVIVDTEFAALQLEYQWIKQFDPPFNIRFKDDKSYPYIAISVAEKLPRVFTTRNRDVKGLKYFGPYTQAWAVRETIDALLKVYPIRSCTNSTLEAARRANRACLLGDIGKCSAPCVGRVSEVDHRQLAKSFAEFLAHGDQTHLKSLKTKMDAASDDLQYELAANFRDQIGALEAVLAKSNVVFSDQTDADLFSIADDELSAAVVQFIVRDGRIRGVHGWVVDKELERSADELVEYVIQNAYTPLTKGEAPEIPKEVLVPGIPSNLEALTAWLESLRGSKVSIRVPQRGDKLALAKTALMNAKHSLMSYKTKRTSDFTARANALTNLQKALGLADAPLRIECYDVSHLSGTNVVGSMVVFEDGLPKKNQYRKFNIENTTDDTASLYQMLSRRLKYLAEGAVDATERFSYRPNLLVIDGGKPQVSAAHKALVDANCEGIMVVGIAKRLEELWLPESDYPIILARASEELFMIQRLRDEAHRFAITAQRGKRKLSIASQLAEIPGLGEKRVAALLRTFKSVSRLKVATVEEIASVAGIGEQLAGEIASAIGVSPK